MVVPYFKKKKMYEILKSLVDVELDIMTHSVYSFYRGSEWLTCSNKGSEYDKAYKLYHQGYFVSLDICKYNEENDKYEEIDRITYRLKGDELIKEYHRAVAYKITDEISKEINQSKNISDNSINIRSGMSYLSINHTLENIIETESVMVVDPKGEVGRHFE